MLKRKYTTPLVEKQTMALLRPACLSKTEEYADENSPVLGKGRSADSRQTDELDEADILDMINYEGNEWTEGLW